MTSCSVHNVPPDMSDEQQFQLALAYMVTNPHSASTFLAGKHLPLDGDISPSVITAISEFLLYEERVAFAAQLLDERLFRNVSRSLSLTASIADDKSLAACWKSFRAMNHHLRFDQAHGCAF